MSNIFTFIRDKFAPKSQDAILLKACREGNPHAARAALNAGANPNTPTDMGEYGYSPWVYETMYTGTVRISPILLAATSALDKDEAGYYAVIRMLAANPKTDLTQVVTGHKKEWRSEHHHADGFPPEFEEDYHLSLRQVINQSELAHSQPARQPSDLYPISQQMSFFLMGVLLDREERDRHFKQAFSYLVDGLVAHEKHEQERRLMAKAADQKVASL